MAFRLPLYTFTFFSLKTSASIQPVNWAPHCGIIYIMCHSVTGLYGQLWCCGKCGYGLFAIKKYENINRFVDLSKNAWLVKTVIMDGFEDILFIRVCWCHSQVFKGFPLFYELNFIFWP